MITSAPAHTHILEQHDCHLSGITDSHVHATSNSLIAGQFETRSRSTAPLVAPNLLPVHSRMPHAFPRIDRQCANHRIRRYGCIQTCDTPARVCFVKSDSMHVTTSVGCKVHRQTIGADTNGIMNCHRNSGIPHCTSCTSRLRSYVQRTDNTFKCGHTCRNTSGPEPEG